MQRLVNNRLPTELQEFLRELIDAIPDPIFIKSKTGQYLGCNRAFERLIGESANAISDKTAYDLFPAQLATDFHNKDEELFQCKQPVASEAWVTYPDGQSACFEVLRTVFTSERDEPLGLIGICRDVTERKWAEAALLENEHRFHDIMEFAPIGTGVVTLDGRITEVNHALCKLLGYSKQELTQLTADEITHPDDRAADKDYKQRLVSGEVPGFQIKKRILHKDGHPILVLLSVILHKSPSGKPLFMIGQVQDLSDQQTVLQRDHLMSQVLDNVFDGVITIDKLGNMDSFNLAAEKIFGYKPEEVIGKNISLLMPEPFRSAHDGYLQRYLQTGQKKIIGIGRELVGLRKNGEIFPMDLAVSEITESGVRRFIGVVRDITARKKAEEQIRYLAHHDALTGLPNRFLFEDRLSQAMSIAKRDGLKVALMFVDLDHFKPVNDTFGHETGDLLLQEVAKRLKECLRDSDTAARIGGDEFIILLPNAESLKSTVVVAEKILAKLRLPFYLNEHEAHISASIGVSITQNSDYDEKQLIRHADAAMYQAKSRGRNNVAFYQDVVDRFNDWTI